MTAEVVKYQAKLLERLETKVNTLNKNIIELKLEVIQGIADLEIKIAVDRAKRNTSTAFISATITIVVIMTGYILNLFN